MLDWVKCSSVVKDTTYDDATGKFTVRVLNSATGTESAEIFDYVICCTGHFSTPNVPEFTGMATASCRIIHAHDFRSAEAFAGQDILVVGTSYSAEDIASQCYKYGVKSVTCSWRTVRAIVSQRVSGVVSPSRQLSGEAWWEDARWGDPRRLWPGWCGQQLARGPPGSQPNTHTWPGAAGSDGVPLARQLPHGATSGED